MLLLGNLYGSEVETPRNDASYGTLLKGRAKGKDTYEVVSNDEIGLWADGDVKNAALINIKKTNAILIARNNGKLSLLKINIPLISKKGIQRISIAIALLCLGISHVYTNFQGAIALKDSVHPKINFSNLK